MSIEVLFINPSNRAEEVACLMRREGMTIRKFEWRSAKSRGEKFALIVKFILTLWREPIAGSQKIRIVFVDRSGWRSIIALVIARFNRLPFVIRPRGDLREELSSEFRRQTSDRSLRRRFLLMVDFFLSDFVFRRATLILPVSKFLAERIQKRLEIPADRFSILPVPVKISSITRNHEENTQSTAQSTLLPDRFIMMATNFSYSKKIAGIRHFMPQILQALEASPDLSLVIAGRGAHFEEFKEEMQQTSNRIFMLGHRNDIARFYTAAELFVHLSFLDAFPNVVIEAQAAGLPVIVNNFGGLLEGLRRPGGVVVDNDSPDGLVRAIREVLADPAAARARAALSRDDVLAEFSEASLSVRLREIFQQVLAADGHRQRERQFL